MLRSERVELKWPLMSRTISGAISQHLCMCGVAYAQNRMSEARFSSADAKLQRCSSIYLCANGGLRKCVLGVLALRGATRETLIRRVCNIDIGQTSPSELDNQ